MKKIYYSIVLVTLGFGTLFAQNADNVPADSKKADEKKLEVTGRVQARMVMGDVNSGYANSSAFDTTDFNFRRIRLGIKYSPAKWVGGLIDLKGENMIKTSVTALGLIQDANIWFKPGFLGTVIKVGQFKLPFIREQMTSSGALMTVERGYSADLLQQDDIGLLIELQPLELAGADWKNKLDLAFSLTNGDGSGHDGVGVKKGEVANTTSYEKLINWRVQFNPFGGPSHDGKEIAWKDGAEVFAGDKVLWSIGVAGAHTLGSEAGLFAGGSSLNAYTLDTTFFWNGIYINGDYTLANGNAVPSTGYSAWQATAGYNIPVGSIYIMPVVRYNAVAYDVNANGTIDNNEKQTTIWIGANLFAIKHDLKFQIFYSLLNDGTGSQLKKDALYFEVSSSFGKKI